MLHLTYDFLSHILGTLTAMHFGVASFGVSADVEDLYVLKSKTYSEKQI